MSYFAITKGLTGDGVPKEIKVSNSGSVFITTEAGYGWLNTTTTPLNAGQSYTGSAEQNTFSEVMISCKTDKAGILHFDFSNDSTNWDTFPVAGFSVSANIHEFHTAVKGPRYFRVRFENTSGENQTYLRLYTYYGTYRQGNAPLNSSIGDDSDAIITRGVLVGSTDGGLYKNVPVTQEGHLEVAIHSPRLPFGSIHTENLTPVFQTDAIYGLNTGQVAYGNSLSGTVITSQSMFICSTGTTPYAQAFLQSRKRLRYRPGQGVVPKFTAAFSAASASSYQVAGVGHAEDGMYIGYVGTEFGILHSSYGVREQQLLTITTPSSTNQNVIVTLNGVTSSIAVTNANNANRMAWELSQGTYTGWKAEPTGSSVLFTADAVGNKTLLFNLTGSAGVTGSFVELQPGLADTQLFVSQSEWNGDNLLGSGSSGALLNPQTGNVYQMGIQYLGFGPVTIQAEVTPPNANNSEFVTLHTFDFPNSRTKPSFGNPSFPFSMAVYSAGSTGDLSLKVSSFAGFTEGAKSFSGNRYTHRNTITSVSTTLLSSLFTIRNSRRFGNRTNQSVIDLISMAYACKLATNAYGEFYIIKNGDLVGNPNFSRVDTNSCALFDTAATSVTFTRQEQVLFSIPVGETTQEFLQFSNVAPIDLQPGEWLTVAMKLGTGTATFANVSLNTIEDQ